MVEGNDRRRFSDQILIVTINSNGTPPGKRFSMEDILRFYGFNTIEEAMKEHGFFNRVDEERFLTELYEEDTIGTDRHETMQEMLYN